MKLNDVKWSRRGLILGSITGPTKTFTARPVVHLQLYYCQENVCKELPHTVEKGCLWKYSWQSSNWRTPKWSMNTCRTLLEVQATGECRSTQGKPRHSPPFLPWIHGIKAGNLCEVRVARYTHRCTYVCIVCLCRLTYVVRIQYNNTKCIQTRNN